MAWLERDKRTGHFKVGFRVGDHRTPAHHLQRDFQQSIYRRQKFSADAGAVTLVATDDGQR
jgi:hypothetical protein